MCLVAKWCCNFARLVDRVRRASSLLYPLQRAIVWSYIVPAR